MVREKKSFFGKLMANEELPPQPVEVNHIEETVQERYVEETVPVQEVEQPMESVEDDSRYAEQPSTERSTEEWPTEYEGELYIDMYQTRDNVVVKSTIAGVPPEDLDITIANDMLTIRGERKRVDKIDPGDYFYQECYWGGFSRSVILPIDIDSENIEAELKDGILTVTLAKAAKAKTKKIKIKS